MKNLFIYLRYRNDIKCCENVFGKEMFRKLFNKYRMFWLCFFKNGETDYFLNFVKTNGKADEYCFFEAAKLCYFNIEDDTLENLIFSELNLYIIETNDFKSIKKYGKHKIFEDEYMQYFVSMLGKDNILRLNKETGLFNDFIFFEKFVYWFNYDYDVCIKSYEDACNYVVKRIRTLRKNWKFDLSCNYGHAHGEFFKKYPDLYISHNAPDELRRLFYSGKLGASELFGHPEYIEYLKNNDLSLIMMPFSVLVDGVIYNLFDIVSKKQKNERILELFVKYRYYSAYKIFNFSKVDFNNIEEIETRFKEETFKNLSKSKNILTADIESFLQDDNFIRKHPELELDFDTLNIDDKEILKKNFYRKVITLNDLRKYPILIELLLNKDIFMLLNVSMDNVKYFIESYGKLKFLKLASIFGDSLLVIFRNIKEFDSSLKWIEEVKYIEKKLADALYGGEKYQLNDLPEFFKNDYPDLVLDDNAPDELKNYFYGTIGILSFEVFKNHPEWLKYLDGKDVQGMFRRCDTYYGGEIDAFFNTFNDFRHGVKYANIVDNCIKSYSINLLQKWWVKTNKKFIPDFAVVSTLTNEDDIEKFLKSTSWWKKLIKLGIFDNEERKSGFLKMAYIFGVFDGDSHGFQLLYQYFQQLPKEIKCNTVMDILSKPFEYNTNDDLRKLALDEGFTCPTIYNYSNGIYKLSFDSSKYPRFSAKVRSLMCNNKAFKLLSPDDVQKIFGSMILSYNKKFYEFLLAQWDKLFDAYEARYIVPIQKVFDKILITNKNRKLTWDVACSFVDENKYEVNLGNEQLLDVAKKATIDPDDIEELEKIYEKGKRRTHSIIPRIEGNFSNISYEITRLDDPLPLGIGNLTDCCQRLNDNAESCMVHSMTENNGRLFVVRNDEGSILAQSWVWRNNGVVCFDNIEVPDRVLVYESMDILLKILKAYREASKKLVMKDQSISKVTVGLGYNDIAQLIEKNLPKDNNPVYLMDDKYIYLNDSRKQSILEINRSVRENRNIEFYDDYLVCNKDNFPYPYYQNIIALEYLRKQYSNFEDFSYDTFFEELEEYYEANNLLIIMNANFAIIFRYVDNFVEIHDIICGNLMDYVKIQIGIALKQISCGKDISCKLPEDEMDIYKEVINSKNNTRKRVRY